MITRLRCACTSFLPVLHSTHQPTLFLLAAGSRSSLAVRRPASEDSKSSADSLSAPPAVQTLGHLGQMLQWSRFGSMRDTHEVLLARSEEVYTFIEKVRPRPSHPGDWSETLTRSRAR